MSNSSLAYNEDVKWHLFRHFLCIVQGLAIVISNGLIVATIGRHSALRYSKEYVALAAGALADAGFALGTLSAGVYRIPVWLWHAHLNPASGRSCLLTPHNTLWAFFWVAAPLMMVVLSLDRVLCVAIPLRYFSFTRRYMFGMVSLVYGISFTFGISIFVLNWSETEPVYNRVCWTGFAFTKDGQQALNSVSGYGIWLSMGLYMFVPVLYWYRKRAVTPQNQQGPEANATNQFQQQLNKSVSLSCLFTFVFVGLPVIIRTLGVMFAENYQAYQALAVWTLIISNADPMANLYIYYKKQFYFRKGFNALFQNKTLPPVLDAWQPKVTKSRPASRK